MYPDWLVKHFRKHVPDKRGQYKLTITEDQQVINQESQANIEETARLVCRKCNTTWMSGIERIAAPILKPLLDHGLACDRRLMSIDDLCTIANWVQLRSMVFDALKPFEDQYYTKDERLAFAYGDVFQPLPNTYIWIAPFHGQPWCTTRRVAHGRPRVPSVDTTVHIATGTMNKLAFQLLVSKGRAPLTPNAANLKLGGWLDTARRVFPSTREIDWPPTLYVGDESLKSFQNRFVLPTIRFRSLS